MENRYSLDKNTLPSLVFTEELMETVVDVESRAEALYDKAERILQRQNNERNNEQYRQIRDQAHKILGQRDAEKEVLKRSLEDKTFETIRVLRESLGLNSKGNPSVVVVGPRDYSWQFAMALLDPIPWPKQTSFFTPKGKSWPTEHPEGPVISYFLPSLKGNTLDTMVEEGVHYLQWQAEKTFANDIRYPNFSGFNPSEEGRIEVEPIPGSKLLRANFRKPQKDEEYSQSIVYEAVAQAVLNLFRMRTGEVPIPEDEPNMPFHRILKAFFEEGRESGYKQILDEFKVQSVDDLWKRGAFRGILTGIPWDSHLFHYIGYSLGQSITESMFSEENKDRLVKLVFSPVKDYHNKLDEMLTLRKELQRQA